MRLTPLPRRRFLSSLLLLPLLLSFAWLLRAQTPGTAGLDEDAIEELLRGAGVPGASVAVIRDFEIAWTRGYGVADVATGRRVDTQTLFQAASISKPLTAVAAVRLAQEGRFALDDDANTLLSSWKVPASDLTAGGPVTPRALLSHTSGADDGFGFPGYTPGAALPTLVQILNGEAPSNTGPVLFARPPYRAFKYSGGSTTLMQLALTELTGEPFDALMRRLVLDPLGMRDSTYSQPLPDALHDRAAHAHNGRGEPHRDRWHDYPEQAAAGLWTTAGDLARVILEVQRALAGREGRILSQASAQAMTTPVGVGPFSVGFVIDNVGEGWYFGHGGSNYGFRGLIRGHLRHGYGIVVLANGDNGGRAANAIMERVAADDDWDSLHEPLRR
jgi:CubicO group peptidase (beta-lactamase class C family)